MQRLGVSVLDGRKARAAKVKRGVLQQAVQHIGQLPFVL